MILDKELIFSDAQAPTTGATDSTNVIDLGAVGDAKDEMHLWIGVNTTVTSGGAATVAFSLQTSADNSSYSVLWSSAAIAKATLVAGYNVVKMRLPQGCKRYLKVVYTVATADLTAGKFDALLVMDAQTNPA